MAKDKTLKEIVTEIEDFSEMHRKSDNKELKESYSRYIEIVISEAESQHQYDLCSYWTRLIN